MTEVRSQAGDEVKAVCCDADSSEELSLSLCVSFCLLLPLLDASS